MRHRILNVAWFGIVFFLLSGVAAAQGAGAARKQAESSMLLKGDIDIAVDGSVEQVSFEREEKIPSRLASFVRQAAMQWKFEPILQGDAPVAAHAPMSVRLVADKLENGDYRIRITSASFGKYDPDDRTAVRFQKQTPPSYPTNAVRARVAGDVYAVVKVGPDGRVLDVAAEQVNLHGVASESAMRKWRDVLARSSQQAIRNWTFLVPSEGQDVGKPYWVVMVPISYRLSNSPTGRDDHYGKWESYIPGPRNFVPWREDEGAGQGSPDALADGGVYMDGAHRGPRLLTPLDKG